MGRYSRLHPVHTIKHVVDQQGGTALGTKEFIDLVRAKDAPVLANIAEVETGSHVNGIFLNVQVVPTSSGSIPNIYMIVVKVPADNLTIPNPNVIGSSDIKKFVIHQEMIMCQKISDTANPRTIFKGVIGVPGSYKRMGTADVLYCVLFAPGVAFNWCVECIYKEIR